MIFSGVKDKKEKKKKKICLESFQTKTQQEIIFI